MDTSRTLFDLTGTGGNCHRGHWLLWQANFRGSGGGGSACGYRLTQSAALRRLGRRHLEGRGLNASSDAYDQSDDASISAFCERVWNQFGGVDVLVNNSVSRPMTSYQDGVEAWRESMVTNGTGLFAISQVFLDRMIERSSGSMINIGSIQGVVAPDFTNYEGTGMTTPPDYQFHKHGMVGLTKYLAAWAGPSGVRVNAISPGGLGLGDEKEPFLSQYCRRVYLGRMANYDDIKGAVVLLASEASAYITGQNLVVDGGYSC